MDVHSDTTETALARAIADELHGSPDSHGLPSIEIDMAVFHVHDLVRLCLAHRRVPSEVLERALDRVTYENGDQPSL